MNQRCELWCCAGGRLSAGRGARGGGGGAAESACQRRLGGWPDQARTHLDKASSQPGSQEQMLKAAENHQASTATWFC